MSKTRKQARDCQGLCAGVDDDKARPKGAVASLRPLSTGRGPVPVVPPADNVQLTPVVQPVALVPYSTQKQPLFMTEEPAQSKPQSKPQPKPPAPPYAEAQAGITAEKKPVLTYIVTLLCAALCAIMVIGDFALGFLSLTNGQGITYIGISLLDAIMQGSFSIADNIAEIALILAFALNIIILISSLATINRGVSVIGKICTFIASVLMLGAALFCSLGDIADFGIFICAGLSFFVMLLSFIAKRP
jgi:hypothetical protein